MKLALSKILLNFDIFPTPNTPKEFHFAEGIINITYPAIFKMKIIFF
jgi:hypothetical protein